MLNLKHVRQDTKDSFFGILWFLAMIPLAMGAHYAAKYFEMIEFTIMGWFLATVGAVHLGWALKNRRLYSFPLTIHHPFKKWRKTVSTPVTSR